MIRSSSPIFYNGSWKQNVIKWNGHFMIRCSGPTFTNGFWKQNFIKWNLQNAGWHRYLQFTIHSRPDAVLTGLPDGLFVSVGPVGPMGPCLRVCVCVRVLVCLCVVCACVFRGAYVHNEWGHDASKPTYPQKKCYQISNVSPSSI